MLSLQAYAIIGSCSSVAAVAETNIYTIRKHSAPRTRWLEALELVRFLSSSPQHFPSIPNARGPSCQRQGATDSPVDIGPDCFQIVLSFIFTLSDFMSNVATSFGLSAVGECGCCDNDHQNQEWSGKGEMPFVLYVLW